MQVQFPWRGCFPQKFLFFIKGKLPSANLDSQLAWLGVVDVAVMRSFIHRVLIINYLLFFSWTVFLLSMYSDEERKERHKEDIPL